MCQRSATGRAGHHPRTAVLLVGVGQRHPAGQVLLRIDEGVAVVLVPGELLWARLLVDRLVPVEPHVGADQVVGQVAEDGPRAELAEPLGAGHQVDRERDLARSRDPDAPAPVAQVLLDARLDRIDLVADGLRGRGVEGVLEQEEAALVVARGLLGADAAVGALRRVPVEGRVERWEGDRVGAGHRGGIYRMRQARSASRRSCRGAARSGASISTKSRCASQSALASAAASSRA